MNSQRHQKPITTIHDIKETSKRATQFCWVGILVASVTVVTNIIHGNSLSALLVVGLIAALAITIWINTKGARIAKYLLVATLNIFLTVIAFAEGLNTASTLYFLPVIFAIPFFIENNKSYKIEVSVLICVTLFCFASCVIFCHPTSNWQHISETVFRKMFITNSFCSCALCAVFAYLSIYLERKYANALLSQINKTQDALHARTRFLSNMGHELRTPLNGIIGATSLLRSRRTLLEQKEYLDILKYCSDHMLALVNDILDFNKIEAGQLDLHPVQCNLKNILTQSILPFYNRFEEKNIELKVTVDEQLNETVLLDDLRLVQVLNNLLSNAFKFTEKGFVKIEAKLQEKNDEFFTVCFSVEDTGIGIKESDHEKIFASFWQAYNETTRKYDGTGLGLTICQRLLNMMNSSLQVESEEGKGTKFTFIITVPVISRKKEKRLLPDSEVNDLEGIKILLAEDNIINTMIARKILEDKKACVIAVENGEEALQQLQGNAEFDIILLDLEMPVMDGYTAVKEIRKRYPDIPVVAFTAALMDQEMLQMLFDLGFIDCILKPFQPLDLYGKVRKHASRLAEAEY